MFVKIVQINSHFKLCGVTGPCLNIDFRILFYIGFWLGWQIAWFHVRIQRGGGGVTGGPSWWQLAVLTHLCQIEFPLYWTCPFRI